MKQFHPWLVHIRQAAGSSAKGTDPPQICTPSLQSGCSRGSRVWVPAVCLSVCHCASAGPATGQVVILGCSLSWTECSVGTSWFALCSVPLWLWLSDCRREILNCAPVREISCFLWNPIIRYRAQKIPPFSRLCLTFPNITVFTERSYLPRAQTSTWRTTSCRMFDILVTTLLSGGRLHINVTF